MLYHAEGIYSFTRARNNCANWWDASWQGIPNHTIPHHTHTHTLGKKQATITKWQKRKKKWRKFDLFHQISCARWCVVFGCGACAFLLFSGTFIFAQIMYRMPYTHRNMIDFMLVTRGYELKCFMCYSWWCSHTQRIYLISSHFYYSICLFESFLFYVLLWSNGKRKHVLSLKLFLLTWLCHFKASQVKWLMKVPTVVINYRFFFVLTPEASARAWKLSHNRHSTCIPYYTIFSSFF